ncbi:unnamed protein product [Paramecium pentaurelia]|uniref:Cyclic nucleotide-binding domain-containing protein n=1 Tax=Paramecium pentaurelia TaxID=43138 RepID=A0A8S1TV02_9CILI|nr:unnamed protein product [Paramecium pentaurelia]
MQFIDKSQDYDSNDRLNQRKLISVLGETNKEARDYLYFVKQREEEEQQQMAKTEVFQIFIKTMMEVSNPTSTFRIIWESISMLFIFVQMIYIPMALSFSIDSQIGMEIVNNIMDVFFVIDIILNFRLAYYENGKLECRIKHIALNYLKLWFWIDVIAVLPFDLLIGSDSNQSTQILKFVRLFKFVKIVRLLRVLKLGRILIKIEETFSIEQTLQAIIQFFKIAAMILCIAHWIACIWNIIEFVDEQVELTWMTQYGIYGAPWEVKYITAFYFSITTMITLGYGDISPNTNLEMIFGIIVMVLSSGVFGYSMSSLKFIIQGEDQNIVEIKEQNQKIIKYIKQKSIPKNLQMRVKNYLEWLEGSAQVAKNSQMIILNNLSLNLHTEILTLLHGRILQQVNLISKEFSYQLTNKLIYVLKEHLLGPEEYVFKENQVDSNLLYFIQNGQVQICLTRREFQLKLLGKGDYFGEISFFSKSPRTASAKTLDFVNLMSLNRKDLLEQAHDLDSDLEKLFYIKNCVDVENSLKPLRLRCYICDRPHHIARNCTIMHYRVRRLKVIEDYLKQKNNRVKEFKRRPKRCLMSSSQIIYSKSDALFRYRFQQQKQIVKTTKHIEILDESVIDSSKLSTQIDHNNFCLDKHRDYSEFYSEFNPSNIISQINKQSEQRLLEMREEKEEIANRFRQIWLNSRKQKLLQIAPPRQSKLSYDIQKIFSSDVQHIIFSEDSYSSQSSFNLLKQKSVRGKRLLDIQTQKQLLIKRSTSRSQLEKFLQKKQTSMDFTPKKIQRQVSTNVKSNHTTPLEIKQFQNTNLKLLIINKYLVFK